MKKNLKTYIIEKYSKRLLVVALGLLFIFYSTSIFSKVDFIKSFSRIGNLFYRMFPMDFSIVSEMSISLVSTINIALFASIFGLITTLVILPFITNLLFDNKFIPQVFSAILSVFRTLPALIIASILVALFGVGEFSGFLALYLISIFISTKILKEYAEEIDKKHLDSAKSQGFSLFNIYNLAILKNLKNKIYSVFFLTLESNIRGASVLGLVGAGGIGQLLWKELNHLRYDRVSLIVLALILVIGIIDFISYYFRNRTDIKLTGSSEFFRLKNKKYVLSVLILLTSIIYSVNILNISQDRISKGLTNIGVMLKGMLHPDMTYFDKSIAALADSLLVASAASFFASLSAIIFTYFAVAKISNKYYANVSKIIINIFRTVPPIIVVIIFFRGFGPGMISSFFALYFYTFGLTSKMFAEVLEEIQDNILFSTKSMGISSFIAYMKVIFKGNLVEFISIVLYRFEMNVKNSAILGMVGVGGIGQLIVNNVEFRNWDRLSILLIILSVTIIVIENMSYYTRERIKK
ncbi:MAG: ABC transporter permease subunit [Gemella sp.]|nr:ABC transporter permease subunit [Gemella sp.]